MMITDPNLALEIEALNYENRSHYQPDDLFAYRDAGYTAEDAAIALLVDTNSLTGCESLIEAIHYADIWGELYFDDWKDLYHRKLLGVIFGAHAAAYSVEPTEQYDRYLLESHLDESGLTHWEFEQTILADIDPIHKAAHECAVRAFEDLQNRCEDAADEGYLARETIFSTLITGRYISHEDRLEALGLA